MSFSRIGTAAFSLGFGAILLPNFFFVVDGGQRVILFDRISGIRKKIYGEGIHFMIPLLQRAIFFDVKIKPRIIVTTTGSKGKSLFAICLFL
jgi:prohibitin 1